MIAIPNIQKPQNCAECPMGALSEFSGIVCKLNRNNNKSNCPLIDIVTCGECKHRDPKDKKCDCGMFERQGCIFPVADDYFCNYGERANNT